MANQPTAQRSSNKAIPLNVAIGIDKASSRRAYLIIAEQFEQQHANININLMFMKTKTLKKQLPSMLKRSGTVDVVVWQTGERINQYIRQNLVLPLTELWRQQDLNKIFTADMRNVVTHQNQIYSLPLYYSQWFFLYNKALFNKLKLEVPTNWPEFINILNVLKINDIPPIAIGSKEPWFVSIWFEYLNLRINGLNFHNAFIKGQVPATSDEIIQVFKYWQDMLTNGYFFHGYDIRDYLPLIYRQQAGISLVNSNVESFIPPDVKEKIGYFNFPLMDNQHGKIQVTPINVMFIAKLSQQQQAAKAFITFFSQKKVQEKLSRIIYVLPANLEVTMPKDSSQATVKHTIDNADGQSYFYDREVEQQYGKDNITLWNAFLDNRDIELTITKMEAARQSYLMRAGVRNDLN